MKRDILKTKRQRAIFSAVLTVGILASMVAIVNASAVDRQSVPPPNALEDNAKIRSPAAQIAQGIPSVVIPSVALEKIQQSSTATNTEDLSKPVKASSDTPVNISMHYASVATVDTLAVTIENAGTRPIFVFGLALGGYIHGESGSAIQTIYRPVITDPYDEVGATTTVPQVVPPGQSLTAYIQDQLDVDGLAANVCYTYQPVTSAMWELPEKESDRSTPHIPTYCTTLPLTWVR
jgi:hypothetical protein